MDKNSIKILLVDDDDIFRAGCRRILEQEGFSVIEAGDGQAGLAAAKKHRPHIAFIDYRMPGMDGLDLLRVIRVESPHTDSVMITGFATIETAVSAIQNGAYDYISKPFNPANLVTIANNIIEKQRMISGAVRAPIKMEFGGKPLNIIGSSEEMKRLFDLIARVAPTDSTVLILGESGTGKELFARAIHANSLRAQGPYFAVDCGSLVETLLESELFGHVRGSFTGAVATKHGAFELANGGTFFMDEIGNISLNVQAKLLRAVQERQIRRVGGTSMIDIDVRLVTATNTDLRKAVEAGTFREDLYYRLSVVPIHLPPLRNRKDDIPALVNFFINKYNRANKVEIEGMTGEAMEILKAYNWPGNVRELENTIERAIVLSGDKVLGASSLPAHIRDYAEQREIQMLSLAEAEKRHISHILQLTDFNISKAAQVLKIDRKTLYDKIKKYQITKP